MIGRHCRVLATLLPVLLVAGCSPAVQGSGSPTEAASSGVRSSSAAGAIRLLIDTDMGADDIVAIATLLREPGVEVVGITVSGTGLAHCAGGLYTARALVTALADGPIPAACGRGAALGPAQPFPEEWRAGADSGYGINLPAPAAPPDRRTAEQFIVDLASAGDRQLTILTLGPLTNIAMALRLDPALVGRIDRLVAMAGAIDVPGNVSPQDGGSGSPTAEWNLHADPTAAAEVLAAGLDLTLVSLDATNDVPLTADIVSVLEADHAAAPADIVFELYARNGYLVNGDQYLWDPLAAVALLHPEVVTVRDATVRVVEGDGLDGGRLLEDTGGASLRTATGADSAAFQELFLAALRRGDPRPDPFAPSVVIRVRAGDTICEADLEPSPAKAGLVRLDGSSDPPGGQTVAVFGLGDWTWEQVEAFTADPVFDEAPPVTSIASLLLAPGGSGTAYGEGSAGLIGVACVTGTFEAPIIRLAGPFELLP